jgi:protein-tyrosine phosphatase
VPGGLIDLHCHVLPAVDDGPPDVEGAIALARRAQDDGIGTIAATPHVDWSHPHLDAARIEAEVRALQPRLDAAGVDVRVVTGGELGVTRAVNFDDAELRALALGRGPWLLLECPLSPSSAPGFVVAARSLARHGHRILLAHPERSPVFMRAPELLDELVAEGMLGQITSGALTGRFGGTVREFAWRLLESGAVHVAASDAHGDHRPATIGEDLREAQIDPALATWLARDVPAALLAGDRVPARPVEVHASLTHTPRRWSMFSRLRARSHDR